MSFQSWDEFLAAFRVDHESNFYASKQDLERFTEFVGQFAAPERIPLLLHAYDRYRASSACALPEAAKFDASCHSILISTILASGIQPDRHEAAEILRRSYHTCGHGSDVEPPLTFAERAYKNQPYSTELFDSVLAYRETLRAARSSHAATVKRNRVGFSGTTHAASRRNVTRGGFRRLSMRRTRRLLFIGNCCFGT